MAATLTALPLPLPDAAQPPQGPRHPVGVRLPVPDDWARAIADFLLDREAAGRPATSRRSYRSALEHLARRTDLGPFEQTRDSLRRYIAAHREWSMETKRARRSTLVAFYDWAVGDELMAANPARQLPKIKATAPHPRPVPEAVYQRALATAQPRERLMLRLAHELGMRREEVSRVHTDDLWEDFDGGYTLTVHGKGNKDRDQRVPEALARELLALPHGYAFPGNRQGHLSAEYVGRKIALLMPGAHRMHGLRHSYATRLYNLSGDLLTVQEALGHAEPGTTRRYIAEDAGQKTRLRNFNEMMSRPQGMAG